MTTYHNLRVNKESLLSIPDHQLHVGKRHMPRLQYLLGLTAQSVHSSSTKVPRNPNHHPESVYFRHRPRVRIRRTHLSNSRLPRALWVS